MVVQHNLMAMNSNRMLGITTGSQAKSTEKLSSGYKINRAADDAAGLSISEKMRKQIRGLSQASLNAEDGISAVQTAEGALNEVQDMLQRMNELAVKASNGTMSENDRTYIQNEIDQLVTEIDRVSETTKFNETYLLKGDKEESKGTDVSGIIGGGTNAVVKEGETVEARGNIYQNQFKKTTTSLATGTEETATIKYKDADGNTRTKDITFKVGDQETTAKNFVDAINADAELSSVFKATVGEGGRFEIESLADGTETDNKKNVLDSTKGIEFKSANTTGDRVTELVTAAGTQIDATQGAYTLEVGKVTVTETDGTAISAAMNLKDGDSITIDGKTYTYDANKAATSTANTFKTLGDLQELLGDDYEIDLKIVGTKVETEYDAQTKQVGNAIKSDVDVSIKTDATTAAKKLDELVQTDFDGAADLKYVAKAANKTAVDFEDMKVVLNIVRKADAKTDVNALNFSLQVGADTTEENKISVDIESMSAKSLGIKGLKVDGKTSANADKAVDTIAAAIQKVSTQRSALGAVQNRLEHTIANLDNVVENTTAAESQIRDTDMATEMVKYSNNNILAQAGQAMLAQANQANQGVLSLLG